MAERLGSLVIEQLTREELLPEEVYFLNTKCNTSRADFVISCRGINVILLNKEYKRVSELEKIVRKLMEYTDATFAEEILSLLKDFINISNENASDILFDIWLKRSRAIRANDNFQKKEAERKYKELLDFCTKNDLICLEYHRRKRNVEDDQRRNFHAVR